MSQIGLIIKNEYLTAIRAKSFWIATILVPLLMVAFGAFGGYMMASSDSAMALSSQADLGPDEETITPLKLIGLMVGFLLTIFLMMYGSMIFTRVKTEKTNRIVEILATCVPGRTMMLAKIISVGLTGLTQILLWGFIIAVLGFGIIIAFAIDIPWRELFTYDYIMAGVWGILYFIGGYVFFGSLFAAAGAMTGKNNENQEMVAVLTFVLLLSFYIGQYAVDHGGSLFVEVLSYIPFTSPIVGAVNAITQATPLWENILNIIVLYFFAWGAMSMSGKIYTSSILLKGKRFTPKDIVTFLKSK